MSAVGDDVRSVRCPHAISRPDPTKSSGHNQQVDARTLDRVQELVEDSNGPAGSSNMSAISNRLVFFVVNAVWQIAVIIVVATLSR